MAQPWTKGPRLKPRSVLCSVRSRRRQAASLACACQPTLPGKSETGNFPTSGAVPCQPPPASTEPDPLLPGEPLPSSSPLRFYSWTLPKHPYISPRRVQLLCPSRLQAGSKHQDEWSPLSPGQTQGSRLSHALEPGAKPGWFPPTWEKGIPALSHGDCPEPTEGTQWVQQPPEDGTTPGSCQPQHVGTARAPRSIASQVHFSPLKRAVWGHEVCAYLPAKAADGIAACTATALAHYGSPAGEGCFSPRTRGYGDGRSLTGPWERLIHPGWKELQAQGRAEASHPPLRLGTALRPAASAPSPRAAGATRPWELAPHRPPHTFPWGGANTNPPLAAPAKLRSPET